ncbi:aminoglycoside phosphotransferase family protein [Micromonospora cremea]|uniref:Predicted kinase, aminoglycoside phosphotransferase (APT) family n=1 Tax=Micromonospora cremea TaxID=709881 RepID=A0A1N5TQL9_9ACTN|nr:aminoglycoside phosphotransferase family protein [Micromonospora cremea]SIM50621.1 Predicted kinase, aminoglycoside phosphotransferase (APT) family [Micromonospora cremea]
MPAADVRVSLDLVRRLLVAQHPDVAHLPIEVMANGWDNLMCRLGDELVVRLPRRALSAELVVHEQRWLPVLAPRLPLPVPAPVRVGRPAFGYPWSWSIVPFLPGQVAARNPPADLWEAAVVLGRFLGALHVPAPSDAPANPYRGVALASRSEAVTTRVSQLESMIDRAAVMRVWEGAVAAPEWDSPPLWLHGDLHPANILVDCSRVSGVIDFGDVTSGDPATDLSVAWMLLPAECHGAFQDAYRAANEYAAHDDTWARARGWALALSLAFLAHSADNPLMAEIGHRTLDALLA